MIHFARHPAVKKILLFLFLCGTLTVLFETISCTNIYTPLTRDPAQKKASSFEDYLEYGQAALNGGNYDQAISFFTDAITAKPLSSEARLLLTTAYYYKYELQFVQGVGLFLNDSSDIFANLETLFSLSLYKNKVLVTIKETLDDPDPAGISVVKETADGIITKNNLALNFNLLIAEVLLMPYKLLDSNKNDSPNENSTNGDIMISADGSPGLNTNIFSMTKIESQINKLQSNLTTLGEMDSNALADSNYHTNFLTLDNNMRFLHDEVLEPVLLNFSGITILNDIDSILACVKRISSPFSDNPGSLSDPVISQIDTLTNTNGALGMLYQFYALSNIIGGKPLSDMHSNLNGQPAFSGNAVPYSYTISPWISLTNPANPCTNSDNMQHTILKFYREFTNLQALYNTDPTNALNDISNMITNYMGQSSNSIDSLTNLFSEFDSFSDFGF